MATNLDIDTDLLQKALEVSGLKTKKDTVNLALKELIAKHKQLEIIDLFGKMGFSPDLLVCNRQLHGTDRLYRNAPFCRRW